MRRLMERAVQDAHVDKGLPALKKAQENLANISRHFERLVDEAEQGMSGGTAFLDSWAEVKDQMEKFKDSLIDIAQGWKSVV